MAAAALLAVCGAAAYGAGPDGMHSHWDDLTAVAGAHRSVVVGETVTLRLSVEGRSGRRALFSTSGTVITHQGFLKVYVESTDEDDAD